MSSGPRNRLKMPRKLPKRANRKIQQTREVKYWNTWNLQLIICDDSSSRLGHSTECNLARAGKCKGKFDYCLNSSIFYWKWARKHQPAACCCTGACRPPPQVVPTYAQVLRCCCVVVVVIFSRFFVPAGLKYTLQIHSLSCHLYLYKIPFSSLALGHIFFPLASTLCFWAWEIHPKIDFKLSWNVLSIVMIYSVRVIQVAGKILVYGLGTFIGVCWKWASLIQFFQGKCKGWLVKSWFHSFILFQISDVWSIWWWW